MNTDDLMLNRSLGTAFPDQYVDWAVQLLCDGSDTPSLRILAGLDLRFDTEEIEAYFFKACQEMEINCAPRAKEPRRSLGLVRNSYERGNSSATTAIHMLARLYWQSDYTDHLLSVFYEIEEELSLKGTGLEGRFYPMEALDDLDLALRREFNLFEEAAQLDLPANFLRFIRCDQCGHIGEPVSRYKTLKDRLKVLFPGSRPRPYQWPACTKCRSFSNKRMMNPDVRQEYFAQLRSKQAARSVGNP